MAKKLILKKEVNISIPGFFKGALKKDASVAELQKFKEAAEAAIKAKKYSQEHLDQLIGETEDKAPTAS